MIDRFGMPYGIPVAVPAPAVGPRPRPRQSRVGSRPRRSPSRQLSFQPARCIGPPRTAFRLTHPRLAIRRTGVVTRRVPMAALMPV